MGSQKRFCIVAVIAPAMLAMIAGASLATVSAVERASTAVGGVQANGGSANSAITPDGKFIAFQSDANNLVIGDTNGTTDVFVKDRTTGDVVRVSVADDESQSNGASSNPAISDDGTKIAFQSSANNLVAGDTNGSADVFVRDLTAGTTQACSVGFTGAISSHGAEGPGISGDGEHVTYLSSSNNMIPADTSRAWNIYMRNLVPQVTERVSLADNETFINAPPRNAVCSPDGRLVAFQTTANNVVAGDTNSAGDIFVRDRTLGTTERISLATGGAQANGSSENPSMSADGRYVAFHSLASNLVAGDTNGATGDVFVRDRQLNTTEVCSTSTGGVFGNGFSWFCNISRNGRFVAFRSDANNLIAGDTNGATDVYLRDRIKGTTEPVSINAAAVFGNGASQTPSIDHLGRLVAYDSLATNLVGSDTNGARDVFIASIAIPAPIAPTGLAANPLTFAVELSWPDNITDETGFRLQRKTGAGAYSTIATLPAGAVSYNNNTNVAPATTYTYRLFAFNGGGDSPPSNELVVTTNSLGAPTNLTALAVGSDEVDLAWVDNFTGETGFQIWVSMDNGPFSLLATGPSNKVTYRHLGLTGSHRFVYKVRAVTATNQTNFSNNASAILMAQPRGLNSQALETRLIRITWIDNATNEQRYELWRSVGGGAFALLATLPANTVQYNDTSVNGNQMYSYKVRCIYSPHVSTYSNTDTSPAMLAPTGLAGVVAATRINLTWVDNSDTLEGGFQIFRRIGAGAYVAIGSTAANATSYSDTTVQHGVTYGYKVRAARAGEFSSFSNAVTHTFP